MKISELRQLSFERYKSHRLNSWIISIICGLFIAAVLLIGILSEILVFIFVPFLIMPFFFACAVSHLSLKEKDELSARNLFGFYSLYYRVPFNSSFSVIRSFFKSVLVTLITGIAVSAILYSVFSQSETFIVTVNQLLESISDMSITNEQLTEALEANGGELGKYINLTNGIHYMILSFSFIVFVSREEITIYPRLRLRNSPLSAQIARASIRAASKNFNKAYFGLNWPLLVIMLAGLVGGTCLSIFAFNNYVICGIVGLSMAVALSSTYLPFYFANMEVIIDQLSIDLASFSEDYVKDVFSKYGVEVQIEEHEEVEGTKKGSDDTEPK